MFVPPNDPNKRPKHQCRENPSLRVCNVQPLAAEEHAGKNKVRQHNARDDGSERDGGNIRLNRAFGAEKSRGADSAAGLRVVGAVGRVRSCSARVARAVDGVAAGAAAGATFVFAGRRKRGRGRRRGKGRGAGGGGRGCCCGRIRR